MRTEKQSDRDGQRQTGADRQTDTDAPLTLLLFMCVLACSRSPACFALTAAILYCFCLSNNASLLGALTFAPVRKKKRKKGCYNDNKPAQLTLIILQTHLQGILGYAPPRAGSHQTDRHRWLAAPENQRRSPRKRARSLLRILSLPVGGAETMASL